MFEENEKNQSNPFNDAASEEAAEEVAAEEKDESEDLAEKLQKDLDDLNNKYIRLLADFDNFRKRQAQERESLLKYGAAETLKKILSVLDNIERARKSCEDVDCIQTVKDSFEVVVKNLVETLEKCGLEKINAKGCEFDPNLHEAVIKTPTDEQDEHTIIAELQSGYKLGDNVLRPAWVNVATKPDEDKK